ncbi:hypothetical protein FB45DRAFT_307688 [Roridomyces roridus]|uniref:Uncharacterized protein n=1 Tax=Roridomyces roridus TaxID=1738132 RepID=A0AAD7B720_9AGAR|nr:hypothetical protein FB45DRAFT_307688 [Roridomyces roridus]
MSSCVALSKFSKFSSVSKTPFLCPIFPCYLLRLAIAKSRQLLPSFFPFSAVTLQSSLCHQARRPRPPAPRQCIPGRSTGVQTIDPSWARLYHISSTRPLHFPSGQIEQAGVGSSSMDTTPPRTTTSSRVPRSECADTRRGVGSNGEPESAHPSAQLRPADEQRYEQLMRVLGRRLGRPDGSDVSRIERAKFGRQDGGGGREIPPTYEESGASYVCRCTRLQREVTPKVMRA